MIWNVHRTLGPFGSEVIGAVRAKHQPDAMLRAFRKFKITDNANQKRIYVRRKMDEWRKPQ